MSNPLCAAIRTQQLISILYDYLVTVAAKPDPARVACAACLAEAARDSAARTVAAIDAPASEVAS